MHQIASQSIFIAKHFQGKGGGGWWCHQTLLGSWYAFSHSGLLPQMINPR